MTRRSDTVKAGWERAPHRSLLRATGQIESDADFDKPFIGVCNSYIDLIPGHVHLQSFGKVVKHAVRAAGGVPFEFNTIGVDDGIAMGHIGMRYSLPSRELIADSVETVAAAHWLDGLVCIPNCDKIVPGMLMAALRLNIPTVFVSGGPMAAGRLPSGEKIDLVSVFEGVGRHQTGEISDAQLLEIETLACPTCGSCSGMFTANSMNCLMEALGLALPYNGSILATDPRRRELARNAARRVVELVDEGLRPRDIATVDAFDDAFALDMAMGGSTNTVLHLLAAAREAEVPYDLRRVAEISSRTPYLCKVSPSTPDVHMEDVEAAGGIPAILAELEAVGAIHPDRPTVAGPLRATLEAAENKRPDIIHSASNAFRKTGGLAVLYGNLAPEGAIVKSGAVVEDMLTFEGPVRLYESQDDAVAGILGGHVVPGEVVVIRTEGPRGGPGMPEMLQADVGAGRDGPGHVGRDGHRRPVLGRHARAEHRPRLARGGVGRRDRGRQARRPDPHRRPRGRADAVGLRRRDRAAVGAPAGVRAQDPVGLARPLRPLRDVGLRRRRPADARPRGRARRRRGALEAGRRLALEGAHRSPHPDGLTPRPRGRTPCPRSPRPAPPTAPRRPPSRRPPRPRS